MKNLLDFKIPFSVFAGTNFINCFASAYMFLENINNGKKLECPKEKGGECVPECGNCCSPDVQTKIFCLFDTMCGQSATRLRFDGEPSEMQKLVSGAVTYEGDTHYTIDFLFGFAGYEYRKRADNYTFKDEIIASIDMGKPVIARVRSEKGGCFRVITGYEDERLISPNYAHAQRKPENAPAYDELETLYIIDRKIIPRYTLKDGLERIQYIMEHNISEKLWDVYIEKMGGWLMYPSGDGMDKANPEERKARMQRLTETLCYAWNCHMFGETFRNRYHNELRDPRFTELWEKISTLCYSIDAFGHAVNYLNGQINWSDIHFATIPGISAMLCMSLEKIKHIEMELLDIIKQAIEILNS